MFHLPNVKGFWTASLYRNIGCSDYNYNILISINYNFTRQEGDTLVICLLLHPTSRAPPDKKLPNFVEYEDEERKWKSGEPPVELEWVHLQSLVHTRSVGQESSQGSLEDESKVHDVIVHPLLEDRIFPCFTYNEIGPLHNNDRHKERCMASVLQNLPVPVSPLLAIGVLQIIYGWRIPCSS